MPILSCNEYSKCKELIHLQKKEASAKSVNPGCYYLSCSKLISKLELFFSDMYLYLLIFKQPCKFSITYRILGSCKLNTLVCANSAACLIIGAKEALRS